MNPPNKKLFKTTEINLGILLIIYLLPGFILGILIWRLIPGESFRVGALVFEMITLSFGFIALHCFLKNKIEGAGVLQEIQGSFTATGNHELVSKQELEIQDNPPADQCDTTVLLQEVREEAAKLSKGLEEKERELVNVDSKLKEWMLKCQQIEEDRNNVKKSLEDQIQQKEALIVQYQETIASQRFLLAKHANEANENSQIKSSEDPVSSFFSDNQNAENILNTSLNASNEEPTKKFFLDANQLQNDCLCENDWKALLEKYTAIAVKLGSEGLLGGHARRLSDFSFESSAIDLRRLFEHFKWEKAATIFIYSAQEKKMVFVNEEIKNFLGCSPEKFILNFYSLLDESEDYWQSLISSLNYSEIKQADLAFKLRGKKMNVCALMSLISSGLYQNLVIGFFIYRK